MSACRVDRLVSEPVGSRIAVGAQRVEPASLVAEAIRPVRDFILGARTGVAYIDIEVGEK